MPTRLCRSPRCAGRVAREGYCLTHIREQERERNRASRSLYQTKRWKMTRKRILFEQPLCPHCGELATDVHHITDLADGGDPFDPANLQALCHRCHAIISNRNRQEQT